MLYQRLPKEFEDWLLSGKLRDIPDDEAVEIAQRKNRKSRSGLWRKSRQDSKRRKEWRTNKNQE